MLVARIGNGIFRSTDGGRLWQPSSTGQRGVAIEQILLSPDFASDQTAFSRARFEDEGSLYRSTDGGATWQPLGVDLSVVAMSPEFAQDGFLMGESAGQVVVSHDKGETWESVGSVPDGDSFIALSLAPLFDRWQVGFGFGRWVQNVYRTVDGGSSWELVLPIGGYGLNQWPPQLAYGPETKDGRLLFLLTTKTYYIDSPTDQGILYRSMDGGMSWELLELPADLVPTALAISPTYDQDGLIWLGTADGRVISLDVAQLRGDP
jgi:photosystem II stability/assembly factor-like uncharacterized protein